MAGGASSACCSMLTMFSSLNSELSERWVMLMVRSRGNGEDLARKSLQSSDEDATVVQISVHREGLPTAATLHAWQTWVSGTGFTGGV